MNYLLTGLGKLLLKCSLGVQHSGGGSVNPVLDLYCSNVLQVAALQNEGV